MRVFLSYPYQTEEKAREIAHELQTAGFDVWAYFAKVPRGTDYDSAQILIQNAIEETDIMLVLTSQYTRRSRGIQREIVYAQNRGIQLLALVTGEGSAYDLLPLNLLNTDHFDLSKNDLKGLVRLLNSQVEQGKPERPPVSESQLAQDRQRILSDNVPVARIFIAYSHLQRVLAKDIAELLMGHGKAIFYDAKIKAGASWRQTIQRALDDATHVVVIWTPDAANSDEVEREVSYALARGKVIVPILSKEIPELPYHLHGLHYIVLADDLAQIENPLLYAIEQYSSDEDIWQ
jgi:hypothetical protein